MTYTIATIRPKAHGHNDVRELQVCLDRGRVFLRALTDRGVVLVGDQALLDELAAQLRRRGFGARQQQLQEAAAE